MEERILPADESPEAILDANMETVTDDEFFDALGDIDLRDGGGYLAPINAFEGIQDVRDLP